MALRSLAIDIAFNTDTGKLMSVNSAVDEIRDGAIGASSEIDDLGKTTGGFSERMLSSLDGLGNKMQDVGRNMTKWVTTPLVGAATALGSVALYKGFDRLVGIDTARAKLKGLGHDAEGVEAIMASALDSVRGTSFGMAEAATTAANATAAGVKPGKELTKYLTLTGDAAAIAGMEMGEMGSILNKVQTASKASNGELQQLSDRGLPIYQWLAKEAGVAEGAVFDLAKKGKVSSEMLMSAIENNIGGAAKTMGEESFTAGMANMWSAVGRLGASFLDAGGKGGGFFSQLKPLISDMTGRIDDLGGIAEKAGVKFGEYFTTAMEKVKSAKTAFDELSPSMQELIKKGALFGTAFLVGIGPVLMVVGSLVTKISPAIELIKKLSGVVKGVGSVFGLLTNPIGIAVLAIGLIVGALVVAYNKLEWFRDAVDAAWAWIKDATAIAFEWVKGVITSVMISVGDFLGGILSRFTDFWSEHGEFIMSLVQDKFNSIMGTIKMVMGIIQGIFEIAWPIISGVVQIAWGIIQAVVQTAIDIVLGIISVAMSLLQGDWQGAWDAIWGIVTDIWDNIVGFFEGVDLFEIGKNILQGLIDGIGSMADAVWTKVTDIAGGIADKFKGALSIFSPSRLFKGFGIDTMMGYTIGFEDEAENAKDTAEQVAVDFADSFEPEIPYQYVTNGGGDSAAQNTTNDNSTTQGIHFNPIIEILIQGNADGEEIKRVLQQYFPDLMEEFFEMLAAKRGGATV